MKSCHFDSQSRPSRLRIFKRTLCIGADIDAVSEVTVTEQQRCRKREPRLSQVVWILFFPAISLRDRSATSNAGSLVVLIQTVMIGRYPQDGKDVCRVQL